jgi:outer membrane protein assembly factor BamD
MFAVKKVVLKTQLISLFAVAFCALVLVSCGGSSSDTVEQISAEQRFARGVEKYNEGDYLEAINEFNIVKLQFPGSKISDSSQYLLAECHFKREEFLLAAEEYAALKRNYASSPLLTVAAYKIGLCYYRLAPKSAQDQKYTLRAIDELQAFIEYYPNNDSVKAAAAKIEELNDRLAKKDFDTAELYVKLEYYRAATFYYNAVFEKYHDTRYGKPALFGKIKVELTRKKYDDAVKDLRKFDQMFPGNAHEGDIESLRKDAEENASKSDSALQ